MRFLQNEAKKCLFLNVLRVRRFLHGWVNGYAFFVRPLDYHERPQDGVDFQRHFVERGGFHELGKEIVEALPGGW